MSKPPQHSPKVQGLASWLGQGVSTDLKGRLGGGFFVAVLSLVYGGSLMLSRWWYQASADSNYHFAVARAIGQGHFRSELVHHLPWTILRDMPVDHYWGYHLLLAPFTWFSDPIFGLKLATLAFFVAVPLSVFLFLSAQKVRFAWAWAMLPLLLSNQDWRYLMLRGGHFIVPLSMAYLYAAFFVKNPRSRRAWIVALAYLGMISYQGALVLFPLHVGGIASLYLLRGARSVGNKWGDPLLCLLGFFLGLLLNPYMDSRASTFRYLWYHVAYMNLDPAGLYPGLREFGPLPWELLLANPVYWVFPAIIGAFLAHAVVLRFRKGGVPYAQAVLGGVAFMGLVLAMRAIRMREYAVPWAVCFVAVALPVFRVRLQVWQRFGKVALGVLLFCLFLIKWPDTYALLGTHLPSDQFAGAAPLLQANGRRPVLNLAEGDYTTLRLEYPDIVAVQGLNHYFLYANRPVFDDVWKLRESSDPQVRLQILRRFYERGVRLVALQNRNTFFSYAETHPQVLSPVYRSHFSGPVALRGASIYRLDPSAWGDAPAPLPLAPVIVRER